MDVEKNNYALRSAYDAEHLDLLPPASKLPKTQGNF